MMKITGLSHIFKWENLHNWWLTKYFFSQLYLAESGQTRSQTGETGRYQKICCVLNLLLW